MGNSGKGLIPKSGRMWEQRRNERRWQGGLIQWVDEKMPTKKGTRNLACTNPAQDGTRLLRKVVSSGKIVPDASLGRGFPDAV